MYRIKEVFTGSLKYPKVLCLIIGLVASMIILPAIAGANDYTETSFGLMFGPKKGDTSKQVRIGDIYVRRTGSQLQVSINTTSKGYYMADNWLRLSKDSTIDKNDLRIMNPPDGAGHWAFEDLKTLHEYTINIPDTYTTVSPLYMEVHVGFFGTQIVPEKNEMLDSARGYGDISQPGGSTPPSTTTTTNSPNKGTTPPPSGGKPSTTPTTIVRGDVVTPPTTPATVGTSTPSTTVAKTTVTTQKPRTVTLPLSGILPFTGMNGWVLIAALILMGTGWVIYKKAGRVEEARIDDLPRSADKE